MASEPGGIAAKLGDRFERLWVARQLLSIIAGDIRSVLIEGAGDDSIGVDVWVVRSDGVREGHQCKRENGIKGKWSISDLARDGIIENGRFQILRDSCHRFGLVSSDRPVDLVDLCERTTRCGGTLESFLRDQIQGDRRLGRAFSELCEHLGGPTGGSESQKDALHFLTRFDHHPWDKIQCRRELHALAGSLVEGDPGRTIERLEAMADASIRKPVCYQDVVAFLSEASIRVRNLRDSGSLRAGVERLRDRFDRSYAHLLVAECLIPRPEATKVLDCLANPAAPRLVLLHGSAGTGKSGVVFEVVRTLKDRGTLCLPLRLDRRRPSGSPEQYGKDICGLPASPAACIAATAEGGSPVLVLDQVDALRWTSSHSSTAWDICEELIEEALSHPRLRIILVARTFDINDDPQIRGWLSRRQCERIEVGPLTLESLEKFLRERKLAHASLAPRQKELLRNPHMLYLWWSLGADREREISFRTPTDLMQAFWRNRRSAIADMVGGADVPEVISRLIGYMDRKCRLAAPRRIVEAWPKSVDALLSLGVLTSDQKQLLFSHQSYADYLVAERLHDQIVQRQCDVLTWLRRSQSLLRRSQFRTLLQLLRDDEPALYLDVVTRALACSSIRFHIKHLILHFVGHVDAPTLSEVRLVKRLASNPQWREHVRVLVLYGKSLWFEALHRKRVLHKWLASADEALVHLALNVMWGVAEKFPGRISRLIRPWLDVADPWPARVRSVLVHVPPAQLGKPEFARYVEDVRAGQLALWRVGWPQLAAGHPRRCVKLYVALLEREIATLEADQDGQTKDARRPLDDAPDKAGALDNAVAACPQLAWKLAIPLLLRLGTIRKRRREEHSRAVSASGGLAIDGWMRLDAVTRVRKCATRLVDSAGRALARTESDWLLRSVKTMRLHRSKMIERRVASAFAELPGEKADYGILWLCDRPRRLDLGSMAGTLCSPTFELISRLSPHCCDSILGRLEQLLLTFHLPMEMCSARARLDHSRAGYDFYHNYYGLGQYCLLCAIPQDRLSGPSAARLREWQRKFGLLEPLRDPKRWSRGGSITSAIPERAVPRITDRQWMALLTTDWQKARPNRSRWISPDLFGELTPHHIAQQLGQIARHDPSRFTALLGRLPQTTNEHYLCAILHSVGSTQPPPAGQDSAAGKSWQPASVQELESALLALGSPRSPETARACCRLIETRAADGWSDAVLSIVQDLAMNHPDPEPSHIAIRSSEAGGEARENVPISGTNCVRGCASRAVAAILFEDKSKAHRLDPAIRSLLSDSSVAVRCEAMGICLPLLNCDAPAAVKAFLDACAHPDGRILESHHINDFLRYALCNHLDPLASLLERMVRAAHADTSQQGSAWVVFAWLKWGVWNEIARNCFIGTSGQRKGAAETLAAHTAACSWPQAAVTQLVTFFDDDDREVRANAAQVFAHKASLAGKTSGRVAAAFVASRAFADDPTPLVHAMMDHAKPLKPLRHVLFDACDRITGPLADVARDPAKSMITDVDTIASLLLRLYQQSHETQDSALQNQCLDRWDRLLESGVGYDVLRAIEQ